MTAAHQEATFEAEIVEHLTANGWLHDPDNSGYDTVRALYPPDIRGWLEDTQPDMLAKVIRPSDEPAAQQRAFDALLDDIVKQLDAPLAQGGGTLSVLRRKLRHRGSIRFDMCQAKPADTMNATVMDRYAKVRLRVVRQVRYSPWRKNRSIDLVLFVNGLPIATIEVKTDFTQSVVHGEVQYAHSRQPTDPGNDRREPLLTFGARALVHFVVTNKVVSMTTKLDGPNTTFLPFNKGHQGKGGNPPDPTGSDTAYFWREVLQRDTWMTIVMKYMMVKREKKTDPVTGKKTTSVSVRFPRGESTNISYYAFTATPKAKTMELFGRPGPDGQPAPFHRYTMSQAIDEGFILDVLRNYTPYKVAFKLVHDGQEYDSEKVDKSRAMKSLMNWVRLHPYNISQKVAIIVEHYRANISHLLDGNAKAMVVTGSRKEAVRYQKALEKYIDTKGYDLRALVAFSGTVEDPETVPEPVTETSMNPGLRGRRIADAFHGPEYQVLIVANKFQVGFDQPLLCAMYVDKKLGGVMAVQTLSRLNRTHPGKDHVYVLDFVNEPDQILKAFEPYYRGATMLETTDPNIVHRIATKLDESALYTFEEIDRAAAAAVQGSNDALSSAVSPARHRFQEALHYAAGEDDAEEQERLRIFRSDLDAYVKAYEFLSQIIDYSGDDGDAEMEKRAIFYRALAETLREEAQYVGVDLSGVIMTHHRIEEKETAVIDLDRAETTPLTPLVELGTGQARDSQEVGWEEILEHINTLFAGTDLDDEDILIALDAAVRKSRRNPELVEKARHNTDADFYGAGDAIATPFLQTAVASNSDQASVIEVLLRDASRETLVQLLKTIDFRRWLIKDLEHASA